MFHVDIAKLSGKIVEFGTTKDAVASEIGVNRSTFYRRLRNNALLLSDVHKICELLKLTNSEAIEIFLAS